jgi:RNA polymerase-interacting CarD/CdnL/TRCF family regulator
METIAARTNNWAASFDVFSVCSIVTRHLRVYIVGLRRIKITSNNEITSEKSHGLQQHQTSFEIGDCVIHKMFGVGHIVALVEKQIFEDQPRLYYEVELEKAMIWVPVDSQSPSPVRLLTNEDELTKYRKILTSKPEPLNDNFRVRFSSIDKLFREGSLESICAIVRDMNAREGTKRLSRGDRTRLQTAKEILCMEWSASRDISLIDAEKEIDNLLGVD